MDRRFPSGLLLGTVVAVRETPGSLRKEIHVKPSAPLHTLQSVFVLTEVGPNAPGFPLPDSGDEATP